MPKMPASNFLSLAELVDATGAAAAGTGVGAGGGVSSTAGALGTGGGTSSEVAARIVFWFLRLFSGHSSLLLLKFSRCGNQKIHETTNHSRSYHPA